MKYYKLTTIGVDRKEVGVSPQCQGGGYFGDIQKDFIPFEGKIDFNFDLPIPKMENKAKETTVLSVGMIPPKFLVVKNGFIDFLSSFDIGKYQKWSIKVEHKKSVIEDYSLFYIYETKQSEYIDFDKSEFFIGNLKDYTFVGDNIKITDYENYLSTREILSQDKLWLKHRKIVLNLSNASNDIFRITNSPAGGYYVSEKLKLAIETSGFTGMVFKEITTDKKVDVIY